MQPSLVYIMLSSSCLRKGHTAAPWRHVLLPGPSARGWEASTPGNLCLSLSKDRGWGSTHLHNSAPSVTLTASLSRFKKKGQGENKWRWREAAVSKKSNRRTRRRENVSSYKTGQMGITAGDLRCPCLNNYVIEKLVYRHNEFRHCNRLCTSSQG